MVTREAVPPLPKAMTTFGSDMSASMIELAFQIRIVH